MPNPYPPFCPTIGLPATEPAGDLIFFRPGEEPWPRKENNIGPSTHAVAVLAEEGRTAQSPKSCAPPLSSRNSRAVVTDLCAPPSQRFARRKHHLGGTLNAAVTEARGAAPSRNSRVAAAAAAVITEQRSDLSKTCAAHPVTYRRHHGPTGRIHGIGPAEKLSENSRDCCS